MKRSIVLAIFAAVLLYTVGACTPNDLIEETDVTNTDSVDKATDISDQLGGDDEGSGSGEEGSGSGEEGSGEGGSGEGGEQGGGSEGGEEGGSEGGEEGGSGEGGEQGGGEASDESIGYFEDGVKFSSLPNTTCENENDNIANTVYNRIIKVVFASSGATVTGTDGYEGKITVKGNDVLIDNTGTTEKIVYKLSGTTTDGFFKVYSDAKNGLWLNGVSITNPAGAAINIQGASTSSETYSKGKRTYVIVSGTNTLVDQKLSDSTADYSDASTVNAEEDMKGTFFSEGQLIFVGSGKLNVTAQGRQGICSDEYLRFLGNVTTTVTSTAGNAVRGKDYVYINSGTINVTCNSVKGRKGISTDGDCIVTGGTTTISMSGSAAILTGETDYSAVAGIKADNAFKMSGGTVKITSSATGGKGIRVGSSDQETDKTELDGVTITGGTLDIRVTGSNHTAGDVSSKGFMVGWAIKKTEHTYLAQSGDFTISGGKVTVSSSYNEGLEVKRNLTVNGGELFASAKDDAVNCCGTFTINDGFVGGYSTGNDALDSNGDFKINGGVVFASGKSSPDLALDANTEGGATLYINGGVLFTLAGLENGFSASQTCYKAASASANTNYALKVGSTTYVFKTPQTVYTPLVVSGSGTPTLTSGVTVSGGTSRLGGYLTTGATVSSGTSVSLDTYTGGGGGPGGGGGWPGGGGGRP